MKKDRKKSKNNNNFIIKICFISLGCVRNLVDSETMMGLVQKEGLELIIDIENADYVVVNTCGFLKSARDEAYEVLDNVFTNKKKGAKVIIAGCMTELFSKDLKDRYKGIFSLLGPGNIEDLIKAIKSDIAVDFITEKSSLSKVNTPRLISTPPNYAYLKIAEGCIKNCSYCLIPKIKGRLKSKTIDNVVKEFKDLIATGIKEIILIAQDLGDYGKDLKEKNYLERLLKTLLQIKKDFKIRLLYLYPDSITNGLIDIIASDKRIIQYLDIPLQHVSNNILKAMKRNTTKEKIEALIHALREKIPNIVIRTTFIVGFPGETEQDFIELYDFVKNYELDRVGVFEFSKEEGTLAYDLKDQIDEKIKDDRYHKLYALAQDIQVNKNKKLIGTILDVVIEGYHSESNLLLQGRAMSSAPDVDPIVIINDYEKFDGFYNEYKVEITDYKGIDLVGKIISKIT